MRTFWLAIAMAIVLLTARPPAEAQKATEMLIPIGRSPGLSGTRTIIGTIDAVNPEDQTFVVTDPQGRYTVEVTPDTRIWLDRSAVKRPNQPATLAQLEPGRRVEVKSENGDRREPIRAEWVKVQSN